MSERSAFTEQSIAAMQAWPMDNRWPEGIIDQARYPQICLAQTDAELEEIGRLRYSVFIERDGKRYAHADQANKVFLEPIDKISLNFMARTRDKCAVAVRATWGNDTIADPHLEQVVAEADLDPEALDATIVHSRLVVHRLMSARGLLPILFQSMFRGACMANARFCLTVTRSELIPLFERFGFYQLDRRRPYFDEVYGWMNVLLLDLCDRKRLTKFRSPFHAVYPLRVCDEAYLRALGGDHA